MDRDKIFRIGFATLILLDLVAIGWAVLLYQGTVS